MLRKALHHVLLGVLILGQTVCWVPTGYAAGPLIKRVEVVGNAAVNDASILSAIQSRPGVAYSEALVEADIRALFRRGDFADIRVERAQVPGGIALTYHVVERPVIRKIQFVGNKKIREKKLLEEIGIRSFRPLVGEELAQAIAKIKDLYTEKRYYLVDVDYAIEPGDAGSVLTFRIREHGKAAVRRIQFVGNKVFRDTALKKVVRSKEKGAFPLRTGKYRREQLEQDTLLVARHYLNHGYLRIQLDRPRVEISKDKRHIFLTFVVDEGQRYTISDVRVEGDILTTHDELRAGLHVKIGDIYKLETVEQDLEYLGRVYGNLGYAFANIQPIPVPDDASGTAELVYGIQKGRRVYIDRINISGNTTTRDKVIRRELLVKEGDLFNRAHIEKSREKLMQLGFFEDVAISTPRGRRPDHANLNIVVKEKPTGSFNIGAGFSTAENFFFTGSVSKQNFFGRGISGQVAIEFSKLRQQYIVQFSDPYFLDTSWIFGLSSYRTVFRYPEFDRKAFGGSVSLGHRFFEDASVSVGYTYEDVKASNFLFSVPNIFQQHASGRTSAASVTVAYDTRDNRIFPSKGVFASVTNQVSGSALGGDNSFYRVDGQARLYQPLVGGIITKAYVKTGYIKSLESGGVVPLFDRYLLGGPNSLRGYNIWTIGPSLRIPSSPSGGDTRFVYGGNKMLQGNIELELPIYNPAGFRAVAFFDIGNAFAEEQKMSLKSLRANYGAGLRWLSPLGPLRFEWGFPINKQAGEPSAVFNFTIGDLL